MRHVYINVSDNYISASIVDEMPEDALLYMYRTIGDVVRVIGDDGSDTLLKEYIVDTRKEFCTRFSLVLK